MRENEPTVGACQAVLPMAVGAAERLAQPRAVLRGLCCVSHAVLAGVVAVLADGERLAPDIRERLGVVLVYAVHPGDTVADSDHAGDTGRVGEIEEEEK